MSVKSTNYLKEYSVAQLLQEYNFYIPEIQREYVWGRNERDILSSFCDDIISGKNQAPDENILQQKIEKLTAEKKFSEIALLLGEKENGSPVNIGFLYSYQPNYKMDHLPDSEIYKDSYLIDGQQRFTTLFLMTFYVAIKENRRQDFLELLRFNFANSSLAFDYRVRALTHDFVLDLIDQIKTEENFLEIENNTWFLKNYLQDVTINSMVNALGIIRGKFIRQPLGFYDFILRHIRFWHFKTEKTNQGEELYITMNSRGKQLEENETVRAKLFENITDIEQSSWSTKWEDWQDFFWKNKGNNVNADIGFNEFLKCIAGLESYLQNKNQFIEEYAHIYDKYLIENLSLLTIEKYFNALQYLLKHRDLFIPNYEYAGWVDQCLFSFKEILFGTSDTQTNWFVDYEDSNKATERRRMVFVWSILLYIKQQLENPANLSISEIYRFARIYWLRFNNLDRAVASVKDRVQETLSNGLWSQRSTKEEELKHTFFLNHLKDDETLRKFESRIWKIEDHRLNLNGYQVENINSSHLIDYKELDDYLLLDKIYNNFTKLFPNNSTDFNVLINDVLMFYGFYGNRRTPFYYYNYDFSNWRRIVRDLDSDSKSFAAFFSEYNGSNLDQLLSDKKKLFLNTMKKPISEAEKKIECDNLENTLRLYIVLCDNIWKNGRYIAYTEWENPKKHLTTFEKNENKAIANKILYNTKGTFRGYGLNILSDFLPTNHINKLKELC